MKKSEQKQAALELLADQAKAYNQDHDDAYCEGRFRGILHAIETLGYDTYYEIEEFKFPYNLLEKPYLYFQDK